MKSTLSLYFASERTYFALAAPTEQGLELQFASYVTETVRGEEDYLNALEKLEKVLPAIAAQAESLTMCVPIENVFVHHFPALPISAQDELKRLLGIEIRQAYPHYTLDDFTGQVYPLVPALDGNSQMLAVLMDKKYLMACEFVLGVTARTLEATHISQFAAHGAFAYNYPEYNTSTVMLAGVQERFVDISILRNGKLAYYNLFSLNSPESLTHAATLALEAVLAGIVPYVDAAFFFGPGLRQDTLQSLRSSFQIPAHRMNAFRYVKTAPGMSQKQIDYCIRTAHLYPSVIGSMLPPLQEQDIIFL
jgi:hypothetical protein